VIRSITTLTGRPRRDFIYEALADLDASLCVDIGAAAGAMTRRMREAMRPEGRVFAFEPFPGNHPHFRATTAELTNVTLIGKAVADEIGTTELYVDSVVRGVEPGWSSAVGYSSVGYLPTGRLWPLRKGVRALRRLLRDPASLLDGRKASLKVATTTLDGEFPHERVDFIKVDVQGAEARVLKGARRLLEERRVGLWYVEWSGDPVVVRLLEERGYALFDSTYVGNLPTGCQQDLEALGFEVIDRLTLSIGQPAYEMIYRGATAQLDAVMKAFHRAHRGWIQTDLIAVSPALESRFTSSVRARLGGP
jgi:FkbM family methyltransferase